MHPSYSGCWRTMPNFGLGWCSYSSILWLQTTAASSSPFQVQHSRERVGRLACLLQKRMMSSVQADSLDPYVYTSGRWLVRERQELEARRIQFDFDALCRRVVQVCAGASSIRSYSKKEGGFNRVFLFALDNDKHVVARLPFSLAGPRSLVTNSEVATIKYLQSQTEIPIPAIIDWSDDPSNAISNEYIIMEHASGTQLHQQWPSVTGEDKVRFMDSISRLSKEMTEIKFPAYGSLYLKSSCINSSCFVPLNNGFYVGPHCGAMFWNCSVGQPRFYHNSAPNHGPWVNLAEYSNALVDAGISRVPPTDTEKESRPRYHGSVSMHLQLLNYGRSVIEQIAQDPRVRDVACPTLFHPDLHKRNIFVSEDDPAVVTSIIDWQSTSIEPAFWYTDRTPDFAQSHEGDADPTGQLCAQAFELCFKHHVSRLAAPQLMSEAFFRPFRYCYRTWKDGAIAFRHELMETARHWDELGFPGTCAFPPLSPEDRTRHHNEYRLFEAAQNLRHDLARLIDAATDGWVPYHEYEKAEAFQHEMHRGMVRAVLENEDPDPDEPIRTEADLREIWPFDL